MPNEPTDLICGVERDIIERFLTLVRDKYPRVDEANYFLELNLGTSGINVAISNQRDVLSHLVTLLTNSDLSREDKLAQIADAEEHLRRAIIESYEQAVSLKLDQFIKVKAEYETTVLLLKGNSPLLASAPDLTSINARLRTITELREKGRATKARNRWDAEWENGVENLIAAFHHIEELLQTLGPHIVVAHQVRETKKNSLLAWWGLLATLASAVLSIILAYVFYRLNQSGPFKWWP